MKKEVCIFIISLLLTIVLIWIAERIVVREGYVDSIKGEVVTIVTSGGIAWEWGEENDAFTIGERVKLVMNNNGTEKVIEDDVIKYIIRLDK